MNSHEEIIEVKLLGTSFSVKVAFQNMIDKVIAHNSNFMCSYTELMNPLTKENLPNKIASFYERNTHFNDLSVCLWELCEDSIYRMRVEYSISPEHIKPLKYRYHISVYSGSINTKNPKERQKNFIL